MAPDCTLHLLAGEKAARAAGAVIRRHWRTLAAGDIRTKGTNDFVTRVDLEAEAAIRQVISRHFPDHRLLAEETGGAAKAEWLWVIDPLDGTTNFIHGIPHVAVSLALLKRSRVVMGLIFDPLADECFHALLGQGAFLNGQPIRVSRTSRLQDALGATGFPFKAPALRPAYARAFRAMMDSCQDMRRCGAAALDLAYVACGRCDFFWEAHLLPWDFLAGKLIVEEAGGVSRDFSGARLAVRTSSVLAANRKLHPALQREIGRHFR